MKKTSLRSLAAVLSSVFVIGLASAGVFADGNPPARIVTPPKPVENIHDDGQYHDLVTPGYAEGGTLAYSLDGVNFWTTLPGANAGGVYTVYYRANGDNAHSDSPVSTLTVVIVSANAQGFIENLFFQALGRHADPQTINEAMQSINAGSTPADIARNIFASSEFQGRNLNNDQFVTALYRTLFGREPDDEGKRNNVEALNRGTDRMTLVNGFLGSVEFSNTCARYGFSSSGTSVTAVTNVVSSSRIRDFVGRLYRKCLGRAPDRAGHDFWSNQLANHQISGTNCAYGFFFSSEFVNARYSNEEYVRRLYSVFFDREPDSVGLTNWVTALNNGTSRQTVFYGFARSDEFSRICNDYGIVRG